MIILKCAYTKKIQANKKIKKMLKSRRAVFDDLISLISKIYIC